MNRILENAEKLIALEQIGDQVEPALDRRSIWRYVLQGVTVDGTKLKLESAKVGGKRYTSLEAWQRFVAAQNRGEVRPATKRQHNRRQKDASRRLAAAGLLPSQRKKRDRAAGGQQHRSGPLVLAREPANAI